MKSMNNIKFLIVSSAKCDLLLSSVWELNKKVKTNISLNCKYTFITLFSFGIFKL